MTAAAGAARPAPSWSSARRVFVCTLVGVFLLQVAWIITLPAFGGMDEFDHAYRAASVAGGHVSAGASTAHGRGGQVVVPKDLVTAASAMCGSYDYTEHDNCHPARHLDDGEVVVDSGASSYNPVYYAVVGILAHPFHGASFDFAARFLTALMAALLLAWAAVIARARSRSTWPFVALVVVTTPTLIYSSAVTSPNGVGYAAAALVWSAAVGFVASDDPPPMAAFVVGCVTLLVAHSTSLVWLTVIAVAVLLLRSGAEWIAWMRRHSHRLLTGASVVLVTAVGCLAWILTQRTNYVEVDDSVARHAWPEPAALVGQWVVWCLQTVGAFPIRDQPAPLIVYPMWLVPFLVLMVLGWRSAERRVRAAMVVVAVAWVVIPTLATIKTYAVLGYAWQGRYALPISAGLPILAGMALAARGRRPSRTTVLAILCSCGAAQALSVLDVAARGQRAQFAPTLLTGHPGAVVAGLLALTGGFVISLALTGWRSPAGVIAGDRDGRDEETVPPTASAAAHALVPEP